MLSDTTLALLGTAAVLLYCCTRLHKIIRVISQGSECMTRADHWRRVKQKKTRLKYHRGRHDTAVADPRSAGSPLVYVLDVFINALEVLAC